MNKKIGILLIARSGSKRLPNKHFLKLNNSIRIIDLCILRLKKSDLAKKIFLCTTKNKIDDKFEDICKKHKINFFRGNENDVLKRIIDCAKKYSLKTIVRITGDCPIIDSKLIDKCIKLHFENRSDYTTNTLQLSFPHGLDVEVVDYQTLKKSYKISKGSYNKEHVTPFIRVSKLFKKKSLKNSVDYSNRRWTLDYLKDYFFLKRVFKHFYPNIHFTWKELISAEKVNEKLLNLKRR